MDNQDNRTCRVCGETKTRALMTLGYKRKDGSRGIGTVCKACDAARRRAAYRANPEPAKAHAAAQRARDPDGHRLAERERYWSKREAVLASQRRSRARRSDAQCERDNAAAVAWKNRNPEAKAAHQAVLRALKAGDLFRPAQCETPGCSNPAEHAHHPSYDADRRLDVKWLCRHCHSAAHSERAAHFRSFELGVNLTRADFHDG